MKVVDSGAEIDKGNLLGCVWSGGWLVVRGGRVFAEGDDGGEGQIVGAKRKDFMFDLVSELDFGDAWLKHGNSKVHSKARYARGCLDVADLERCFFCARKKKLGIDEIGVNTMMFGDGGEDSGRKVRFGAEFVRVK